jgi:hypothetical protein
MCIRDRVGNAEKKSFSETVECIQDLITRYVDKKLSVADVSGATFTITDLSAEHIDTFTPLVSNRQSAILGISGNTDSPGQRCFCLTFDHRVADGRVAGKFLHELKTIMESYRQSVDGSVVVTCSTCMSSTEDKRNAGLVFIKVLNSKGQDKYICQTCLLMN